MSKKMSKTTPKHNLLVVAHPDDETLFFAGLILSETSRPWHIVLCTDANADNQGKKRMLQFKKAAKKLGVKKLNFINLPDQYSKRLDIQKIKKFLSQIEEPACVYTHGPTGEYGHPHHQDVCLAVHEQFKNSCPVFAIAHNCRADKTIKLNKHIFSIKAHILARIYFSETKRFIQFVPATNTESFSQFSLNEVQTIYNYLAHNIKINTSHLDYYKWFEKYFIELKKQINRRPF